MFELKTKKNAQMFIAQNSVTNKNTSYYFCLVSLALSFMVLSLSVIKIGLLSAIFCEKSVCDLIILWNFILMQPHQF